MEKKLFNEKNLSLDNLKEYIYKNRYVFMFGVLLLFLIHGKQLYVLNARVDTEVFINNPNSVYNWLDVGRQGGIFTRILFEQLNFNPYFVTAGSFIVLSASMIAFGYLFQYVGKMSSGISVLIFLIFLVHPIWVEQFYFTLQILVIAIAIFLTAISILMSFWGILNNKKFAKVLSIVLMVWIFSTYQLFIVLYVAGAIFSFLLFYKHKSLREDNEKRNIHIYIKLIFNLIILFLIAMIINSLITKLFFSNGAEYLTSQIRWGIDPVEICIKNIITHVTMVALGKGVFYSYTYIISIILMLSCLLYDVLHMKEIRLKWLYVLAAISLQVCPFIVTIYGGTAPVFRAQFVLPFVIACNLGFTVMASSSVKYKKTIASSICVVILIIQTHSVMRMEYTDDIRFQEDMRLGSQISERIGMATNGEEKPIAFIGSSSSQLNASCIRGEFIGRSIFDVDAAAQPHFFYSSGRITSLLRTMGYKMQGVSSEQVLEARKIASEMPIWPAKESVYDAGDFVVVKLSVDNWYAEEIMEPESEKVEISDLNFNNDAFKWAVDSTTVENNIIKIRGWLIKPNVPSKNGRTKVYLINESNGTVFKLATFYQERIDLNNAFINEADYINAGYISKAHLSDLDGELSQYKIILGYNNSEEETFVDTGVFIK